MKRINFHEQICHQILKTREYYKEHGFHESILRISRGIIKPLKRFIFLEKEFIFFELNLYKEPLFLPKNDDYINIFKVWRNDLENFQKYDDGKYNKNKALKRISQGCKLLVAKDNDNIIYYEWLESKRIYISALDLMLFLPDQTVYSAWSYTNIKFRNKGYASRSGPFMLKLLKECGYKHLFLIIDPINKPSIRLKKKVGYKEYQTIIYKRFLFLKYYCLKDYSTDDKLTYWCIRGFRNRYPSLWKRFSKFDYEIK